MDKSVIIIGAGIAGLSAGCYGQMTGYRTSIFEMQDKPGGVCTSWQRDGYTIDGGLEWVVGSAPGNEFYGIWEELGAALPERRVVNYDELGRIEGDGGKAFVLYTDINRLEQHMKDLAPEDNAAIRKFISALRTCTRYEASVEKAPELMGLIDRLKKVLRTIPFYSLTKWKKISTQDFADSFDNPFLREAFHNLGESPETPMIDLLMSLAWHHRKVAGYPVGGSLEFARSIERRYLNLGGKVNYSSPVASIRVENDQANGVILADGSEHSADIVISAADGHATIFDLLDGRYASEQVKEYYERLPVSAASIQVALGVSQSFVGQPHSVTYFLDRPLIIAGQEHRRVNLKVYNFDQTLTPEGKTVLKVTFPADYEFWKALSENPKRYKDEKEHVADRVVALLDQRFPGLKGKVDLRDVATPATWEQYTGNWRGACQGWMATTRTMELRKSRTLPGLKNFYMAGQWVEARGGLPQAAVSGRNVMQVICKRDRKPFVPTIV